jgi:hypothetical protein
MTPSGIAVPQPAALLRVPLSFNTAVYLPENGASVMQLGNVRVLQVIVQNIFHVISYNIQGDPGEMSVIWEVIVSAIVRKKKFL